MICRYGRLVSNVRLVQSRWHTGPFSNVKFQRKTLATKVVEDVAIVVPVKRKRGRPRKDATPSITAEAAEVTPTLTAKRASTKSTRKAAHTEPPSNTLPKKRTRTRTTKPIRIPARLLSPASKQHSDLPSFLSYASRTNLSTTTNVYKGTHYEYTVAAALSTFNFTLHRTGRSNDLGIDLVGHFRLPHPTKPTRGRKAGWHELRVLVQCKALKPTPAMVRELEGAYVGAPAGWNSDGVLALLVASRAATKGVRDALQRSRWPMGLVQVTTEGEARQFLWNPVAAGVGLEGLGVTVRYGESDVDGGEEESKEAEKSETTVKSSIALTWLGKLWRPTERKAKS